MRRIHGWKGKGGRVGIYDLREKHSFRQWRGDCITESSWFEEREGNREVLHFLMRTCDIWWRQYVRDVFMTAQSALSSSLYVSVPLPDTNFCGGLFSSIPAHEGLKNLLSCVERT